MRIKNKFFYRILSYRYIAKTDNCGPIELLITGVSTVATFLCAVSDMEVHSTAQVISFKNTARDSIRFIANMHTKHQMI